MSTTVEYRQKTLPLSGVSGVDSRLIELFVHGVQALGLPKSIGAIYGILFTTAEPMALDTLAERLGISRGSASQGLRFLRNLGAVKAENVPGDRRDHYVAETSLKKLVGGFVRGELTPHLESGVARVAALRELAAQDTSENAAFRAARIEQVEHWLSKGGKLVGLMEKFLT